MKNLMRYFLVLFVVTLIGFGTSGQAQVLPPGEPGTIWAWGSNWRGQLGDGTRIDRATPIPVLSGVTAIACPMDSSMALLRNGTVMQWGSNNECLPFSGNCWDLETYTYSPLQVPGLSGIQKLGVGWFHSFAIDGFGALWAWGNNTTGQLGDGTYTYRDVPVRVPGLSAQAHSVAGGMEHSIALLSNGAIFTWGANDKGQLGNGTTSPSQRPIPVPSISNIKSVSAGVSHSIALTFDGEVYTWGNEYCRLGNQNCSPHPNPVLVPDPTGPSRPFSGVQSVVGGGWHTVALKGDGTVWSWGTNDWGQLGIGTQDTSDHPYPLQVLDPTDPSGNLTGVVAISAKCMGTVALKYDGTVVMWGRMQPFPTRVQGLSGISAIAAGMDHTLALSGAIVTCPDADGDGYFSAACGGTDCNDADASIHPETYESCNSLDDNCNGQIDEGVLSTHYRDWDGDGFGRDDETVQACSAPVGYVANHDDCSDYSPDIYPGADEYRNDMDDDCDGQVDETTTCYWDSDRDGYGNPSDPGQTWLPLPSGCVIDGTDCNDRDAAIHPGAGEICNGKDDNCNGHVDEGVIPTFYPDSDKDGFGDPNGLTIAACLQPAGYVPSGSDCDDTAAAVHPGADEICNGLDDGCDGLVDEGFSDAVYVDDDDPTCGGNAPCYSSIKAAVLAACSGNAVYVRPGTYTERVDGPKPVRLRGAGPSETFVKNGFSFERMDNVAITGFHFLGDGPGTGISLYEVDSSDISGNEISGYYTGIYIRDSNFNTIQNNYIHDNRGGAGIQLGNSFGKTAGGNQIRDNRIQDNVSDDIICYSCDNIIENNTGTGGRPIKFFNSAVTLHDEELALLILCGANYSRISNLAITGSDTVKNNGLHVIDTTGSIFENIRLATMSGLHALEVRGGSRNTFANMTISGGGVGFATSDSVFRNNTMTGGGSNIAFSIRGNWNNVFHGNTVTNYGIIFYNWESMRNNVFTDNVFDSNYRLFYGYGSTYNANNIFSNNFFGSSSIVSDGSSPSDPGITWNTTKQPGTNIIGGPFLGGNYWRYYSEACADADGDGICDAPLAIPYYYQGGHTQGEDQFPLTYNTRTGAGSTATFNDKGVTVTFGEVTASGRTDVTISDTGPEPPGGFALVGGYYDIRTTALHGGTITVCVTYDESDVGSEAGLRLFHFEDAWTDVTTILDTAANRICGDVSSLSPFIVAQPTDNAPPVVTAPPDLTVTAQGALTAVELGAAAAVDDVGVVSLASNAPAMFPLGITLVTWTATDAAGNTGTATQKVTVAYQFEGFLPPVSLEKPHKLGSTIPVKFRLGYAGGVSAPGATALLTLQKISIDQPPDNPLPAESTSGADAGNRFRYDAAENLYIYNLSTRGLTQGNWRMAVSLDDGTQHTVPLALKK